MQRWKKRGERKIDRFRKKLMIPGSEISECPEHEVKPKIGNILMKEEIWMKEGNESDSSKIKPLKTGKKVGATYCLGCKDYTHNLKPQEIKMTNKVLKEKSNCVVCWSTKSRFLKQKHSDKK